MSLDKHYAHLPQGAFSQVASDLEHALAHDCRLETARLLSAPGAGAAFHQRIRADADEADRLLTLVAGGIELSRANLSPSFLLWWGLISGLTQRNLFVQISWSQEARQRALEVAADTVHTVDRIERLNEAAVQSEIGDEELAHDAAGRLITELGFIKPRKPLDQQILLRARHLAHQCARRLGLAQNHQLHFQDLAGEAKDAQAFDIVSDCLREAGEIALADGNADDGWRLFTQAGSIASHFDLPWQLAQLRAAMLVPS